MLLSVTLLSNLTQEVTILSLKPGTKVTWISQSNGSTKVKVGEIIEFVAKGVIPSKIIDFSEISLSRILFNPDYASSLDRYIVKVSVPLKKGGVREMYYSPRASLIKLV